MSYQKSKVQKFQVQQLVRIGCYDRLPQLYQYQQTLEVQLPNIFNIRSLKISQQQKKQHKLDQLINTITKNPIKQVRVEDHLLKKLFQPKITFYNIVKMLFPEPSGLSALAIGVMDTIFYNQDGSMTYVYTDGKRGLLKTKAKNYIQIFFKRKAEVDSNLDFSKRNRKSQSNFKQSIGNQQKNDYLKNLDYVALLKYKDQNFIRLKQHEFKSLFIRPVQANQKYKTCNALYLQLIPQQVNYEEGTIYPIQFILQKHINSKIFQKAVDKHCEQTSYNKCKVSQEIKSQIKQISIQAYLLYIIFQIYAYINIHHHKQITYGIFQFMRSNDTFYLSNTRKIKLNQSQDIKNQYTNHDLFEQFVEQDKNYNICHQKITNGVLKAMEQLFDKQNKKITCNIKTFIQKKLSQIQDKQDNISSNQIFHSINQKQNKNLHQLLNDEVQYYKIIKKKQQQLDGFSPLTSISNICRKKYKNNNITSHCKNNKKQKNTQTNGLKIRNYLNLIQKHPENKVCPWAKWYKQTLSGKKQYYQSK